MAQRNYLFDYVRQLQEQGLTDDDRVMQAWQRSVDGQPLPAAVPQRPIVSADPGRNALYNAFGAERDRRGEADPGFQALSTIGGNMQAYGNMHPRADLLHEVSRRALSQAHDLRSLYRYMPREVLEAAEMGGASARGMTLQEIVDSAWTNSPTDMVAESIERLKGLGVTPPWSRGQAAPRDPFAGPEMYPQQRPNTLMRR